MKEVDPKAISIVLYERNWEVNGALLLTGHDDHACLSFDVIIYIWQCMMAMFVSD